jgi:hypothetical protein
MLGDNLSAIKSVAIQSSNLKEYNNELCYHRVCEAITSKYVMFCHIDGKYNPVDLLSKHIPNREWRCGPSQW